MSVKFDSNATGLRLKRETSIGVIEPTDDWFQAKPNDYEDTGATISTVASNPINPTRQLEKGTVTDVDATLGFGSDLSIGWANEIAAPFLYSSVVAPSGDGVIAVAGSDVTVAGSGAAYYDGDIVSIIDQGTLDGTYNVASVLGNVLTLVETPVGSPTVGKTTIARSGFIADVGDFDIDASGSLPRLTSTTKDFAELDINVGDWIFIGGDGAGELFVNDVNNGFARVSAISTNYLEFDKSDGVMVSETGTGLTIRLSTANTVTNGVTRTTFTGERYLAGGGYEYIKGCAPNSMTVSNALADKITVSTSYVGTDTCFREDVDGPVDAGATVDNKYPKIFNTSSDIVRLALSEVGGNQLFALVDSFNLTVNNNVVPNKALSVIGAFDLTAGQFEVTGDINAYFADVNAVSAVKDNADVELDFAVVTVNEGRVMGLLMDLPLVQLGDGKVNITANEPIYVPLTFAAFRGANDYTMRVSSFMSLPVYAQNLSAGGC